MAKVDLHNGPQISRQEERPQMRQSGQKAQKTSTPQRPPAVQMISPTSQMGERTSPRPTGRKRAHYSAGHPRVWGRL